MLGAHGGTGPRPAPTSFPVAAPAAAALAALEAAEGAAGEDSGVGGGGGGGGRGQRRTVRSHQRSDGAAAGAGRRGGGASSLPAHLASTSAIRGCLAATEVGRGGGGGGASATRIMAPWSKMRSVEAGISSALDQSRYNSGDIAAKAYSSSSRGVATGPMLGAEVGSWVSKGSSAAAGTAGKGASAGGRGGASAVAAGGRTWQPLPVEASRGTADTRIMKAARQVMHGLDLEAYK